MKKRILTIILLLFVTTVFSGKGFGYSFFNEKLLQDQIEIIHVQINEYNTYKQRCAIGNGNIVAKYSVDNNIYLTNIGKVKFPDSYVFEVYFGYETYKYCLVSKLVYDSFERGSEFNIKNGIKNFNTYSDFNKDNFITIGWAGLALIDYLETQQVS